MRERRDILEEVGGKRKLMGGGGRLMPEYVRSLLLQTLLL